MDKRGEVVHKKGRLGRRMDEKIVSELDLASGW